jgi:predicted nucleic acid-binding Zn ribbon protein
MSETKNKYYCMVCGKELDYEPQLCCSGRDCGCLGMPVDPPVCSNECYDKLPINKDKL